MAITTNLVFSCVVLSAFVSEHYALDFNDDRQPSMHIFHHSCALKRDEGPCKAIIERYYFNIDTGFCESFDYGGCHGNDNNFRTLEDCENMCIVNEEKSPCYLTDEPGPCRGLVPRYFYERQSQKCKRFFYGGCFGNANNFRTMKECEAKCQQRVIQTDIDAPKPTKHSQEIPIPADVVTQPPLEEVHTKAPKLEAVDVVTEAPVADAHNESHKLEPVDVVTAAPALPVEDMLVLRQIQEAAELNIPHFCLMSIDRGTCDGMEKRYTYNPKKKRCQLFRYSGCGGNKNNFVHKRHCMKMCMKGHSNLRVIRIKKKNSHILHPAD
ncbi:tissue factor pathway inhibitor a [Sardina pilchardus]|uniref:tissue factor pathway inhibitor a n=1 Tax=Sardina pilchardus TaxID=27697 RepID=UPI002E0F3010